MIESDQITCKSCGNPILLTTAAKNDGECMPCVGGYRESMEASRRWQEERRKSLDSPGAIHWRLLVHRENAGHFNSFTDPEKIYFAVTLLDGEVYNGGFYQYFSNSSADYYDWAVVGLKILGATNTLSLLQEAKEALFGDKPVPSSSDSRNSRLKELEHRPEWVEIDKKLDALDCLYYKDPDSLGDLLEQFAIHHELWTRSNEVPINLDPTLPH